MQGQRSAIGSLPETLDFDHGSSSSNPDIDSQLRWANMRNPGELGLQDFILPPGDTGVECLSTAGYEGQNLSKWNMGESSSSSRQNEAKHDEFEHEWSSLLTASSGLGPRLQEWQREHNSIFSVNNDNAHPIANQILNRPLFMQSSTSDSSPQNLNLNAGFVGHVEDDCQVVEYPNSYKSSGSVNCQITSANCSSDPFGLSQLPSGSDGRSSSSVDGRSSCKRKAIEGNIGQSSVSGGSRCFQRAENVGWQPVPSRPVAGRTLRISSPSDNVSGPNPLEHVNPRHGLGLQAVGSSSDAGSNVANSNSHRNLHSRISSSYQQDSVPLNFVPPGGTYRNFYQQSSRILPADHSLVLTRTSSIDNDTNPQSQPAVIHASALPQNVQSVRFNGGSSSRLGTSTASIISGERTIPHHEEGSLRNVPRHIMEHPLFLPGTELRNLTQNPASRTLHGGNLSIPRNGASNPRSSSSSAVHPSYAHSWVPHRPSSQHSQRLSEHLRRALLGSSGSDSGGVNGSHPPLHAGVSASSQEAILSSGANIQGNHRTYPRIQGDGSFEAPYSLRTLAAAGEGRSRLVSEIRSVLDLMRRGEGLRFEDVMILDQSMLFGVADAHDRHRDMRLDVDNMSYEELLALEERIGDVNTGLKEETILYGLKKRKYVCISMEAESDVEPCSICREEYQNGEDLGVLECGHDFHTDCIKQWLTMKNICPICKTTAIHEKKT